MNHPDRVRRNYAEMVASEYAEAGADEVAVIPAQVGPDHTLVSVDRDPLSGHFVFLFHDQSGTPEDIVLSQEDVYYMIRLIHGETTGEPV